MTPSKELMVLTMRSPQLLIRQTEQSQKMEMVLLRIRLIRTLMVLIRIPTPLLM